MRRRLASGEAGQILPLFALVVVALFAMAALLFDAAQALVARRQLQDATDAAALAAANVIQSGSPRWCSASNGPPPGSPRDVVVTAARSSLTANLSATLANAATITCPNGWGNYAVRIELSNDVPSFFQQIIGRTGFTVAVRSTAVNGFGGGSGYSVLTLNPGNPGWGNKLTGCPSMLFSGSPSVDFYGSVQVNSSCTTANGGALQQNGNAAVVNMYNGSRIEVVGDVVPGKMTFAPSVDSGKPAVPDPLAYLPPVQVASMPVQSASRLILNNANRVFEPGVYVGGIEFRNKSRGYFHPGIYVLQGGGVDIGAQAEVYTVRSGVNSSTQATWAADCPATSCGILVYNMAQAGLMGQFNLTAGATVLVRGYLPEADPACPCTANNDYRGLLFWQDKSPIPLSNFIQPDVILNGGGTVNMIGTFYAPSAKIDAGGTSSGAGTYAVDYPLQFICWDITFRGTAAWRFQYDDRAFVRPPDYGLVE
jgi:putative Flp pilus-assembly TadE/G-like protein